MSRTIVAIVNQKGGVGKSTTAVNLAGALARRNGRVLVVDCDHQANATLTLLAGETPARNLYHLLHETARLDEVIQVTARVNLDVLPAGDELAGVDMEFAGAYAREQVLRERLAGLTHYDTVFLDCPPSLGFLTWNALTAATHVLIPVQATMYSVKGLALLLQTIRTVRQKGNPSLEVLGVLITQYDRWPLVYRQAHQELRTQFGSLVFAVEIPKGVAAEEAHALGINVLDYDDRSSVAVAYEALAEEFQTRLGRGGAA